MNGSDYGRLLTELLREAREYRSGSRGPRSRIVEAILALLYARPMRSSEIARYIGRSSRYVSSYLSYWRARGLVEYESGYWYLTEKGEQVVRMIMERVREASNPRLSQSLAVVHTLLSEPVRQTRNRKTAQEETGGGEGPLSFIAGDTGSQIPEQSHRRVEKALECLRRLVGNRLSIDERDLLEHLVKHYIEWGSSYVYLDQLTKEFDAGYHEIIAILKQLQVKKLIYIYMDRRFGARIGLNKSFRKLVDTCIGSR
ncbi:MAG: replication initiator protein WhiP [Thermoprotei archaeon]|nr:MAG: replication initiator protein WhiP [Thermoprotei archaeon]